MDLIKIVRQWLRDNGYDGVVNLDTGCECSLDDIMHCGEPSPHCEAGHREADGLIYPGKAKE